MRVLQSTRKRPLNLLAMGTGGHIAAACSEFGVRGDVEVWDVGTGKLLHTHPGGEREVCCLAFTPDGTHLLVGQEEAVMVFDTPAGTRAAQLDTAGYFPEFAASPDGSRMLVTETDDRDGTVACHAFRAKWTFRHLWGADSVSGVLFGDPCYSRTGKLAAVSVNESRGDRVRNLVHVLDAATGKVAAKIEFDRDGSEPVEQVAFSADGSRVFARARSRYVKVFDAATGAKLDEIMHPGRPFVTGMAVHPNGSLACVRNNGTVCVWNAGPFTLKDVFEWKVGKLVSVAFAPDGTIGAAGTEDGQVVLWDVDE